MFRERVTCFFRKKEMCEAIVRYEFMQIEHTAAASIDLLAPAFVFRVAYKV